MPLFTYTAKDSSGALIEGEFEAADRRQAVQRLTRRGLSVVSVTSPGGQSAPKKGSDDVFGTSSVQNLEDHPGLHKKRAFGPHKTGRSFIEKIYSLMNSGLPAGDSIKLLSQRVSDPALRALATKIWHDLSEGVPLANSMSRFPEVFDQTDVRLVEAGEATGTLLAVIKRLIEYGDSREKLRSKIIASMAYPIFIICVACSVIALFIFYLMPMLQDMMGKLGGEMNVTTKILVTLSQIIIYVGPFVLIGVIIAFFAIKNWRQSEEGKIKTDEIVLKIPLIAPIIKHIENSRLCSLISTLMENGLNTPDALRLGERAAGNVIIQERISSARTLISDGASFTNAFRRHEVLPLTDLDIVAVGESTGTLPAAFKQISATHEIELDSALHRLIVVLSAVFLGAAVSIVFLCLISIVLTILSVSQSAGQ